MEMPDEEFTRIKNFLVDTVANEFDIGNAPDDVKTEYTEILQIVNSFGQEAEASPEMAAPA